MERPGPAVHRTIVIVDVEGFGDRRRSNAHQIAIRAGLYRVLRQAFELAGIPWANCDQEDRGDGVFILAPAEMPKSPFVDALPQALVKALREHNAIHSVEAQIRLRMALHAGEVRYDQHGATANAVNLAFRLLDAAALKNALADSPGVLVVITSEWFFDEVVRHSSAGDAATYRPVHVTIKETSTVAWISLPDHPYSPALRHSGGVTIDLWAAVPAPTALSQLPPRVGGFTGRAADLSTVRGLLEPGAGSEAVVVSAVAGLAGVGKTALAIQAAHAAVEAGWFPGGVLFVDLHGYAEIPIEAAQALDSLLRALGVPGENVPAKLDERAGLYRSVLAGRAGRVLVIADNASSARQVRPLLPGDARHRVLVTSRHTLSQLSARLLNLDTLTVQEAVDLLDKALRTAKPDDFRVRSEAAVSAEVASLCGRLPLALQITVARLAADRQKPLMELRDELKVSDERLAQLDDGERAIRSAFDLSYQHLTDDQAYLFRLLGLHPGSDMSTPSAAVLAGRSEPWTRRVLGELARANMVQQAPVRDRWRMHDLIRDYARDLISREPAADRRQRTKLLLDYYWQAAIAADKQLSEATASTTRFATRDEALAWLEDERPNLHACVVLAATTGHTPYATGIAQAIAMFLRQAGYWQQAITVHGIAAAAGETSGDYLGQAHSLNDLGFVQQLTGQYKAADASHSGALRLYRELGDRHGQACALNNLGRVHYWTGRQTAMANHTEALRCYQELGDRLGQADALNNLGSVQYATGEYLAAARSHSAALRLYRQLGNRLGQADALNNLGRAHYLIDRYEAAVTSYLEALRLSRDLGDRLEQACARNNLGRVQRLTGKYADAAANHSAALKLYRDLGDRVGEAGAYMNLGTVQYLTDNYIDALTNYSAALRLCRDVGDVVAEAAALNSIGMVRGVAAEYESAVANHSSALKLFRDFRERFGQAAAFDNRGRARCLAGEYTDAASDHSAALQLYRELGNTFGEATALNNLGRVRCMTGKYAEASANHSAALLLYRRIGTMLGEAAALNHLGRVHCLTEEYAAAVAAHTEALALYQEIEDRLGQAIALKNLRNAQYALGEHAAAAANNSRALRIYQELQARLRLIGAQCDLAGLQMQPDKFVHAEW